MVPWDQDCAHCSGSMSSVTLSWHIVVVLFGHASFNLLAIRSLKICGDVLRVLFKIPLFRRGVPGETLDCIPKSLLAIVRLDPDQLFVQLGFAVGSAFFTRFIIAIMVVLSIINENSTYVITPIVIFVIIMCGAEEILGNSSRIEYTDMLIAMLLIAGFESAP